MTDSVTKVGVGALIIKDGRALFSLRKGSFGAGEYGTIGGHLEYLESFEEAILREVREEAGLEINNLRFLCLTNSRQYLPKHFVDVGFVADWVSGEPKVLEPEYHENWSWHDINEPPSPLFGFISNYIEAYKTGQILSDA